MCSIGTCISPPFCCIASDAVQANIALRSVIATVAKEHVKERLSNIRIKRLQKKENQENEEIITQ
jgi:hypothetical protein